VKFDVDRDYYNLN